MPIDKSKSCLILLGASEFPQVPSFTPKDPDKAKASVEAFNNSHSKIKQFFTDTKGVAMTEDHILDLFNEDIDSDTMDVKINTFVERSVANKITDLIIYYTGHGTFSIDSNAFVLATRRTRAENPGLSSITFKNLSQCIKTKANSIRTFIILDCCFSGIAQFGFMSGEMDVIKRQIDSDFPESGVALLCSSSSDEPSIILYDRKITMFTEGLEKAFRTGSYEINSQYLTFRQLHKLTLNFLEKLNNGKFVRPEVHSPDQTHGNIADMPHFPNFGFDGYDIEARRKTVVARIIANDLRNLAVVFLDFANDFDADKRNEDEVILILSRCNALEDSFEKNEISRFDYNKEREMIYRDILAMIRKIINKG